LSNIFIQVHITACSIPLAVSGLTVRQGTIEPLCVREYTVPCHYQHALQDQGLSQVSSFEMEHLCPDLDRDTNQRMHVHMSYIYHQHHQWLMCEH
jgi:hypothetical protein